MQQMIVEMQLIKTVRITRQYDDQTDLQQLITE
jgi:hypothetical protein